MVYSLSMITASFSIERSIPCRKFEVVLATLARNSISNTCAKAFESIKQIITCTEVIALHRFNSKDFIRTLKLTFHVLIVFLIKLVKGLYQEELDKLFKTLCRFDVSTGLIAGLQYIFQKTVEPVNPEKIYPRKQKAKPLKSFPLYKQN